MATTRIMPLHVGKGRTESRAISDIIDYVANPQKTDNGKLITGYACDSRTADAEFLLAKRQYITATGRVRGTDDVIAYHVRQSFRPGEITPEEANRLGVGFAKRFTKGNHAFVVCTHIDKSHIHNHIIWSSVSLEYDRKFRNFWGSTKAIRRLSDTICIENGLSIVENPNPHGKSYNKWLGDQAKPSHRELLRVTIDNALSQSPANFEELLKLLKESGCEVSKRGKSYRLKLPGWEKAARMDSLGEGYGLDDLQAVLSGKKAHTPRKKVVAQAGPPKVNLLVDIQAKLQAGKGAGYARWAKVFNLKQMAQTMNYLSEHNLLEYAILEEKAAAATAHHNELSAQIKVAEKRMAEIAVLRTHIVNYAKTREVYVAYRKAGYSKKFREEHEEEILLHQAAKNAFDEMGPSGSGKSTLLHIISGLDTPTSGKVLYGDTGLLDASSSIQDMYFSDYAVTNETSGIPAEAISTLEANDTVKDISTVRLSVFTPGAGDELPFETDLSVQSHETFQLVNIDDGLLEIYAPNLSDQDKQALNNGTGCLVKNPIPFSYGDTPVEHTELSIGDTIQLGSRALRVIGIIDTPITINNEGFTNGVQLIVNEEIYCSLMQDDTYSEIYLTLQDGVDTNSFESILDDWCSKYPGAHWLSYLESSNEMAESFEQIKMLCWVLIIFIGIIGILNIINTVYSNIHTRVNEIGMQRAIGMSAASLYKTFLWEGAYYAIFASVIGAVLGYVCCIFVGAAKTDALQLVAVPVIAIIEAAVVSVAACLLATAIPLHSIAKMNIVETIENIE